MVVAVQVMRAEEAEAAEEAEEDSAFGSNRSSSPSDAPAKPRKGGGEEEHGEEEGEGVASWASVRMLGDRQRQRAVKEEEEVFSLLLKGSVRELHFP